MSFKKNVYKFKCPNFVFEKSSNFFLKKSKKMVEDALGSFVKTRKSISETDLDFTGASKKVSKKRISKCPKKC